MAMVTRAFSSTLAPLGNETVLGQDPSFVDWHQLLSSGAGGFVALWASGFPPDTAVQVARLDGRGAMLSGLLPARPVMRGAVTR